MLTEAAFTRQAKTQWQAYRGLVQTCASFPLQNLEYLLLKKYGEKEHDILALGFMEV